MRICSTGPGSWASGRRLARRIRIEADDLEEAEPDEVQRFELLEAAGQLALKAVTAVGGTWYLSRVARAIVLIRVTSSDPGPQAGARAARSAERAEAISGRMPALRFRAGVGAPHEGPMGLRPRPPKRGASSSLPARHAGRLASPPMTRWGTSGCSWSRYSSDTARASVRDQLAPLEKLGPGRAETAIQTLAAYLDEQGSIVKTAQKLHLHRNAVEPAARHHRGGRHRSRRPRPAAGPPARLPGAAAGLAQRSRPGDNRRTRGQRARPVGGTA